MSALWACTPAHDGARDPGTSAGIYGLEVSPQLISTVTDEVLTEVAQWQARALEALYPIVYFDALRLKIRDEGTVMNKAVYLALGIDVAGRKDLLGLWIEQTTTPSAPTETDRKSVV